VSDEFAYLGLHYTESSDPFVVVSTGADYEKTFSTSTKNDARGSCTWNETFVVYAIARVRWICRVGSH
jgi:hypothetical protein